MKEKKGVGQLQTESLISVVTCKMCLFSLYFVISMVRIWISFVGHFVLRMSDFGGRWSVNLKNRGWSKKTEGRTRPKSKGGSLAVGTYLQRGSATPPPPGCGTTV